MYNGLMEEESNTGWSKDTVRYVMNHSSKIKRQIRSLARGYRKNGLQTADIEDIYTDLVLYLYKSSDYDIEKAESRSKSPTGEIVSIEGYITSCTKCCVMRACKNLGEYDSIRVSDTVKSEDDNDLSIFDSIYDEKDNINIDHMIYDIKALCKSYEPIRYRFGPDLYLVWFVRLLTANDKEGNTFKNVLEVLGISRREINQLNKFNDESAMLSLARAINLYGIKKSLKEIRKYVYSANLVEKTVMAHMLNN